MASNDNNASATTTTPPATGLLPLHQGPKVVVYHQTHHRDGKPVSILPLMTNQTGVTHVVVAAIHINEGPGNVTLNDDAPDAHKFDTLWGEVAWLQAAGIKVLGMLGGAAKGSYARLDMSPSSSSSSSASSSSSSHTFESYYRPLHALISRRGLDGLDLDVEEPMSLPGIVRLIDRLKADFGPAFLVTLAPVATALLPGQQPHLSGFDYRLLEMRRGASIAWYNAQFYCGWGDVRTTAWYDAIVSAGWPPHKVVVGMVTNPANGAGFVERAAVADTLRVLRAKYAGFGGVMGWEYFNSLPGDEARPWEWAAGMARTVRTALPPAGLVDAGRGVERPGLAGGAQLPAAAAAPAPHPFPAQDVQTLQDLGFSSQQAVAALNMTSGNVEYAAGLLFQD